MTDEPREDVYGHTISEWISLIPGDLPNDSISLWHVSVAAQHRFELKERDLADFIKRGVRALLDAGAVPVKTSRGTPYEYIALQRFGYEKEVIVEAIMSEWEASAKDDEYLFSVWFALPSEAVGNLNP